MTESQESTMATPAVTKCVRQPSMMKMACCALLLITIPSAVISGGLYFAVKHLNDDLVSKQLLLDEHVGELKRKLETQKKSLEQSDQKISELATAKASIETQLKATVEAHGESSKEAQDQKKSLDQVKADLDSEKQKNTSLKSSVTGLENEVKDIKSKGKKEGDGRKDDDSGENQPTDSNSSNGQTAENPGTSGTGTGGTGTTGGNSSEGDAKKSEIEDAIKKLALMGIAAVFPEAIPVLALLGMEGDLFGSKDVTKVAQFKAFADALAAKDSATCKAALLNAPFSFTLGDPAGTTHRLIEKLATPEAKQALDARHGTGFTDRTIAEMQLVKTVLTAHPYLAKIGRGPALAVLNRTPNLFLDLKSEAAEAAKFRDIPPTGVTSEMWTVALREYVSHVSERNGLLITDKGKVESFIIKHTKRNEAIKAVFLK